MTVLECLYFLCSTLCMVLIGEWTYHWSVKDRKCYVVAGIIYAIGFSVHFIEIETLFPLFILYYVGEFIAWLMICKGKVREKIFKMLGIYYGLSALEALIQVAIENIFASLISEEWMDLLVILLIMVLFAIITRQKWYRNIIDYLKALSRWKTIMILCIIVTGTLAIAFSFVIEDSIKSQEVAIFFRAIMAIVMSSVAIIIVWLIIESYEKKYYLNQNALKEEYIQIQKDYYKTIYEKEKEMRSFRHDIASHLGLLKMMLERGESEKAIQHLEGIYQEFAQVSFQKIHIGDELLDAILSMMNQQALEKDIKLEVMGKIENIKKPDVYELCTIFSNAISNAVEACIKVGSKGPIIIKILEHNEMLFFIFENPGTEEMYQEILKGDTSKSDKKNHGFGVLNMKRAVSRLQGNMEYRYESGKIILEILI